MKLSNGRKAAVRRAMHAGFVGMDLAQLGQRYPELAGLTMPIVVTPNHPRSQVHARPLGHG